MSMEIHVLFHGKLPTKPALARAMKELSFPITIPSSKNSLEKQSGFLPMRLRGEETGAEFDVFEGRAHVAEVAGEHEGAVDLTFDRCASFRFGGDENEMIAAMCAAAALAKLVGGVVLDSESGELMPVDEAITWAESHFEPIIRNGKKQGTEPADIKRYLKPLLKQRDDLVLVGRRLIIRPVRHILRGVYLDRWYTKDIFNIWNYVEPLFAPGGLDYSKEHVVNNCAVTEPYFEPLLMDALAEDVFADVGRIRTLDDFAALSVNKIPFFSAKVLSLALAGSWDRAAEYVEQIQNDPAIDSYVKTEVKEEWTRVSSNIDVVCAELRAKEAAVVRALEIEHMWEPSPFPVELPATERARVSEPAFSTTPWISRPPWLLGEAPDQPGEIRYAEKTHIRDGRVLLVMPVPSEEAEQRHRAEGSYAMAARLPDGAMLLTKRLGLRDKASDRPKTRRDSRFRQTIFINFLGPTQKVSISADQGWEETENIVVWSWFSITDWRTKDELWDCYLKYDGVEIRDRRTGQEVSSTTPITNAVRNLAICPVPEFGEAVGLAARIRSFLDVVGFGPLT
jgi:hypothetical protein